MRPENGDRPARGGLQNKLVATYVGVGVFVTVLTLAASTYIRHLSDERRAARALVMAEAGQLGSLVGAAAEEGFSYVLSGDEDERQAFRAQVETARALGDGLASSPRLTDEERSAAARAVKSVAELGTTGTAMFTEHDSQHNLSHGTYHAYDDALDRSRDAIDGLQELAAVENIRAIQAMRALATGLILAIGALAVVLAWIIGRALGRRIAQPDVARELTEAAELADMATERAAHFVRSIRSQARSPTLGSHEVFDVMSVVRDSVSLFAFAARSRKCTLTIVGPAGVVELLGNASGLGQAITNLLQNAIDATNDAGGGRVLVHVESVSQGVTVRVVDNGGGIPADVFPRIFDALFTTKPYGLGTGLGLGIVKEAVEGDFGGTVGVETTVGQGTSFALGLPRRSRSRAA